MAFSAGQALLSIAPDFSGIVDAIDAEAAKWGESAGQFFADAFKARVDESVGDTNLGPNDAESAAQGESAGSEFADAFRLGVGSLDITPKVDPVPALAGISEVDVAAQALGEESPTITPKVDPGPAIAAEASIKAAADGANGSLRDTGSAADAASSGMGGLLTTALALGPALIPIGAVGLAGLSAMVPILVSATAGLGAFGLAAEGDLGTVENAAKETLTAFQNLAAPEVIPVITGAISLIGPVFAALMPLVDSTATELGKLEDAARSTFTAPFWQGFITFLSAEAGPAIGSLATLFGGVATGFAGFAQAMSPLISEVESGLDGIGNSIGSFGTGLSGSTGFQSFLAYVQTEAPVVGQLLENLAGDVEHLLIDLAPAGAAILAVVTPLTGLLNTLLGLHGPFGLNIADLGLAYLAYSTLAPLVKTAEASLLAFFSAVNGVEVAGASESALAGIVTALGGIGPAAAIAAPLIVGVGVALFAMSNEAAQTKKVTDAWLDGLTTQAATTLPQITEKIQDLQTKIAAIGPAAAAGKLGFNDVISATEQLKTSLTATEAEQTTYNSNLDLLTGKLGISKSAVETMATSLNIDLGKGLDPTQVKQFSAALDEQAAKAGLTQAALVSLAAQAGITTTQMQTDLTTAASTTSTAWASLGNAVNNFSSATLPPTATAIATFYTNAATQGAQFSANIQKAIQDGYNPQLIEQILQAGPQQAGQLLQGLVSAQGGALSALINQTTGALAKEGTAAVEEARLTEEAVTAKSSEIAAALPQALALSQQLTVTNAAAAVQAVATQYNLTLPQVVALAKEYGIALPNNILAEVAGASQQAAAQAAGVNSALGQGLPAVTGTANALAGAVPAAVTSQIPAVGIAGDATAGAFVAELHAHLPDAQTEGAGLATSVGTGIGGVDLSPAGTAALTQVVNALTENGGFLTPKGAATSLVTNVITQLGSLTGLFSDAGGAFTNALATGVGGTGVLSNLLSSVDSVVAKAAAAARTQANILAGAAATFGIATPPGRATGGPILPNTTYLVGERGPELVQFPSAGYVVPNSQLATPNNFSPASSSTGPAVAIAEANFNNEADINGLMRQAEFQRKARIL